MLSTLAGRPCSIPSSSLALKKARRTCVGERRSDQTEIHAAGRTGADLEPQEDDLRFRRRELLVRSGRRGGEDIEETQSRAVPERGKDGSADGTGQGVRKDGELSVEISEEMSEGCAGRGRQLARLWARSQGRGAGAGLDLGVGHNRLGHALLGLRDGFCCLSLRSRSAMEGAEETRAKEARTTLERERTCVATLSD